MIESRGRAARILRVLGWTFLALVLAVYIGFPVAMAVAVVWPSRAEVGAPPDGFEAITLTTTDNVELAAWYARSSNGVAVIVAHGAGGSRESMRRQAIMLAEHGYGVLSLDLRGHGQSDGRVNRLGWEGTRDVSAAVDFLKQQTDVEAIGALGSSMGGEVLLGACATCPEIQAIVADGATRRCTEELLTLPSERPLVRNFTARVMYSAVQMFTWSDPPEPLLDQMLLTDSSEFMLIAAGDEQLEVAFNEYFADSLGERVTVWVPSGVGHTGAYSAYPNQYEERVLDFLDDQLLGSEPDPRKR